MSSCCFWKGNRNSEVPILFVSWWYQGSLIVWCLLHIFVTCLFVVFVGSVETEELQVDGDTPINDSCYDWLEGFELPNDYKVERVEYRGVKVAPWVTTFKEVEANTHWILSAKLLMILELMTKSAWTKYPLVSFFPLWLYILLYLLPDVCHPSYKLKSNARQVCGEDWVEKLVVCQTFWILFVCTIYGDWHYNGISQEHIWLLHWWISSLRRCHPHLNKVSPLTCELTGVNWEKEKMCTWNLNLWFLWDFFLKHSALPHDQNRNMRRLWL